MLATARQLEILDLRHFSAPALRPLLREQAALWERRLLWDYSRSVELLLEYVDSRSLTGYVALRGGRVAGYTFGVSEATKAVLGDVYAFGEAETRSNPVCDRLVDHLLETLQATPGLHRIESQLLLFPDGALHSTLVARGMRPFPRLFMVCPTSTAQLGPQPHAPLDSGISSGAAAAALPLPRTERWQPEAFAAAAALIHESYAGHMDSNINDQYRTLGGAQRFLHNIVHFPGCGVFDPSASWLLYQPRTGALEALILCSRVRHDAVHITQICVRPAFRGQGLGRGLLRHCLQQLALNGIRTVSLTVTEANTGARRLYEEQGFRTQHRFEAWVWDKARG